MTGSDRSLVEDVYARGVTAFDDRGIGGEDAKKFLARQDVQDAIAAIDLDAGNQEVLLARTGYAARRSLQRMLPRALQVLADSLEGPEYIKDEVTGAVAVDQRGNPLISELPPTMGMREAAAQVLDRLGVGPKQPVNTGSVSVAGLLNQAGDHQREIDYGPATLAPEQRAIMRERMRLAIERLAARVLPKAKRNLERVLKNPKKALRDARRPRLNAPRSLPPPEQANVPSGETGRLRRDDDERVEHPDDHGGREPRGVDRGQSVVVRRHRPSVRTRPQPADSADDQGAGGGQDSLATWLPGKPAPKEEGR